MRHDSNLTQGGKRLKEFIKTRGTTMGVFAKEIGITGSTLSRIIHGLQEPSLTVAVKIKRATSGYILPEEFVIHNNERYTRRSTDSPSGGEIDGSDDAA